jgi:hypothetical protein
MQHPELQASSIAVVASSIVVLPLDAACSVLPFRKNGRTACLHTGRTASMQHPLDAACCLHTGRTASMQHAGRTASMQQHALFVVFYPFLIQLNFIFFIHMTLTTSKMTYFFLIKYVITV